MKCSSVGFVILSIALFGCVKQPIEGRSFYVQNRPHPLSIRPGANEPLTEAQIADLAFQSIYDYDAEAAWRLENYYLICQEDWEMARIWRKYAAQLGHMVARRLIDEERYELTPEEERRIDPQLFDSIPEGEDARGSTSQHAISGSDGRHDDE